MKKYLLTITTLLSITTASYAQDAKMGTTLINKVTQPCVVANYNYPGDVVEGALKKKLTAAKIGSDSKATDNFKVYKGVIYNVFTADKIDLYYKVEDKKTTSTVYILASKGYDNFYKYETDSIVYINAINYLNTFINDATAYKLNEDIVAQQKTISNSEKELKSLEKDEAKILKSKAKIESNISKNNLEINPYKTDMEKQQALLEAAKLKTATLDQMDALKKEISKQEDAVKSATKKYNNAVSSLDDLTKDLKKSEDELEENKQTQQKQKDVLAKQQDELNKLKAELATIKL